MTSIDVEGHGLAICTTIDMLRANVIDASAPQTASLGDKNWVQLWGFHGRQVWRLYYEALFLCMVSQYHDFDTFNPVLLSP